MSQLLVESMVQGRQGPGEEGDIGSALYGHPALPTYTSAWSLQQSLTAPPYRCQARQGGWSSENRKLWLQFIFLKT